LREGFTEGVFHIDGQSLSPDQWWRTRFFGTINNLGNAADSSDPDGDGLNNLAERALGNSPIAIDQPDLAVVNDGETKIVRYKRANPNDSGCVCQLEWSETLKMGTWSSENLVESLVTESQGIQTIQAVMPPSNNGSLFVRLRMTGN
jgi:hypothetical protein